MKEENPLCQLFWICKEDLKYVPDSIEGFANITKYGSNFLVEGFTECVIYVDELVHGGITWNKTWPKKSNSVIVTKKMKTYLWTSFLRTFPIALKREIRR